MKQFLLFILLVAGATSAFAQRKDDDKIRALKIAFLTERIQLTSAEAQKFWPVYNSYEAEVEKISTRSRDGSVLENEEKLLLIRKKYNGSFEKILGKEKTNALFQAEKDFRKVLIRRLKSRGSGPGNR